MKRVPMAAIGLTVWALFAAGVATADLRTYLGFHVGVEGAPRSPRIAFRGAPDLVVVPGTRVYVVDERSSRYDVFRYGSRWYAVQDGYWYRASRYGGPYYVVDVRSVPRPVLVTPVASRWKGHPHGGPPGQMKKHRGRGRG